MSHSSWGFFPLVLATAAIGSCSKASDGGEDSEVLPNPVMIHVAGMEKGQGAKT